MTHSQTGHTLTSSHTAIPAYTPAIAHGFEQAVKEAFHYCGATAPNPAVGCSLLDDAQNILLTSAHHKAGTPHAEARALAEARQLHVFEKLSTALVTLEPCNHTGRTGPCTQALIESPIKTVWIGCQDPNPEASGGIERLKRNGVQVVELAKHTDPAAQKMFQTCQALLAPFAKTILQKKPWISVKQALNHQGTMIPPHGQKTFTSLSSLTLAHRLRRATDAIITSLGTLTSDAPLFTIRHVDDHKHRKARLVVICTRKPVAPEIIAHLQNNNFAVDICSDLQQLPALLMRHGILWAMVEAGPRFLEALQAQSLWDDWLTIHTHAHASDTIHVDLAPWQTTFPSPLSLFFFGADHNHVFRHN